MERIDFRRIIEIPTTTITPAAPAFLLDAYTVGVAFSFRRLRTDYAGNCVRIRRSSDNGEQNFGFVDDVVDTAGIASYIGGGSGFVVTYFDQSGNAFDVTQATAGSQPQFIASGINGLPSARFNVDFLATSGTVSVLDVVGSNQATIMFVQNQTGSNALNTTIHQGGSTTGLNIHATYSDVIYFDFGGTGGSARLSVAQPSGWDNAAHISEFYRTTGNSQAIIVDGVTLTSATRATAISGTFTLSIGRITGGGGESLMGDLAEIFTLKTDVGSTARTTLRTDMGAYYGVSV